MIGWKEITHNRQEVKGGLQLNRKQRREASKNGINHKTLSQIEREATQRAVNETVAAVLSTVLLRLRDMHGWGQGRAIKLLEAVDEDFDAYSKGYVNLEDLIGTVESELNISIK